MDADRIFYLAVAALATATGAIFLDAIVESFDIPAGFWAIPGGVLTFITTAVAIGNRRNGNSAG